LAGHVDGWIIVVTTSKWGKFYKQRALAVAYEWGKSHQRGVWMDGCTAKLNRIIFYSKNEIHRIGMEMKYALYV